MQCTLAAPPSCTSSMQHAACKCNTVCSIARPPTQPSNPGCCSPVLVQCFSSAAYQMARPPVLCSTKPGQPMPAPIAPAQPHHSHQCPMLSTTNSQVSLAPISRPGVPKAAALEVQHSHAPIILSHCCSRQQSAGGCWRLPKSCGGYLGSWRSSSCYLCCTAGTGSRHVPGMHAEQSDCPAQCAEGAPCWAVGSATQAGLTHATCIHAYPAAVMACMVPGPRSLPIRPAAHCCCATTLLCADASVP